MNARQIVAFAQALKKQYNTNDPYVIAEKYGIKVLERAFLKDFKAQTLKTEGYPTIISINDKYTTLSKKVLCAHELGHALLHQNFVNHFNVTAENVNTTVEYEANLFAVALLCDEDQLIEPIHKMENTLLKSILDYNIRIQ